MTEAPDPLIGQTIQGRYRVLRLIGRGGMGSVYEVEHLGFGGRFALKTLRPELTRDTGAIRRFKLEARAAAATGHKHIVQVTDMGESADGTPFIVLELLKGRSLAKEIQARGTLSPARSVSIALQCCAALAATHERGIVHRDLKPENIFLLSDHAPADFVKVLDFGVSKFTEGHAELGISRRTTEGTQIGTPMFMSPEQLAGASDVGPASDQFSLGLVLYEMLTGRLPFEERGFAALVVAITTAPARPPSQREPDVPPALDAVVLRTLEKKPENRFGSMAELAAALLPLHRPAHADTSGGWTAALAGPVPSIRDSSKSSANGSDDVEPDGDADVDADGEGDTVSSTTLPRRKPINAPAASTVHRASDGTNERRHGDTTGPIGSRDSGADARSIHSSSIDTGSVARPSRFTRSGFRTALLAAAVATAIVVTSVLVVMRITGGGAPPYVREGTPSEPRDRRPAVATSVVPPVATARHDDIAPSDAGSAADIEPATTAAAIAAADATADRVSPRSEQVAGGGRIATPRGARDPDRPRVVPERATPVPRPPVPGALRSVTIRSEWDATVSVRFACGDRTVRASVPPFGSSSVRLPSTDCMVHCASAAGLPRCPLRLPASTSALAVRR